MGRQMKVFCVKNIRILAATIFFFYQKKSSTMLGEKIYQLLQFLQYRFVRIIVYILLLIENKLDIACCVNTQGRSFKSTSGQELIKQMMSLRNKLCISNRRVSTPSIDRWARGCQKSILSSAPIFRQDCWTVPSLNEFIRLISITS